MGRILVSLLLSGLLRDAVKVAAGLALAILLAQAFAITSLAAVVSALMSSGAAEGGGAVSIAPERRAAFEAAAAGCGLPWQALAAVAATTDNLDTGDPAALPAIAVALCAHGGARDLRGALAAMAGDHGRGGGFAEAVLATAARYGYVAPGSREAQVLDLTRAQLGVPYLWGGASPQSGFDCSGLVQWAFGRLGVALPRTAQQQYAATVRLSRDDLQPGDLVFFAHTYPSLEPITHVGVYLGNGRMIAAPREGQAVSEADVFSGYWGEHYAGAGRVGGGT